MITQEVRDAICEQLADGKSLREICRQDDMPSRSTVLRLAQEDVDFDAKCARARILQAESIADDLAEIEDRTLSGELDPAAARVVLASKQWRASKLAPKKYGDKLDLTGDLSVKIGRVTREIVDPDA